MPKDFIDLWVFGVVGVPTSGKELLESIQYTEVISVDWYSGAMTLDDLA